jgi:hypothetical protein
MKALALTVLLLLGLTSSVSAEGAWVLWQNGYTYFKNGSEAGSIDAIAAYPTYVECQQRLRSAVQVHVANDAIPSNSVIASSTVEAHGDSVTRKTYHRDGNSNITIISWSCLPDGTDPRGTKGGGR